MTRRSTTQADAVPASPARGGAPGTGLLLLGAGWILLMGGFLSFLDFRFPHKLYISMHPVMPFEVSAWAIGIGSLLLVAGTRFLPRVKMEDLSRKAAWTWLGVVLAVGTFLILYGIDRPLGHYWDDWALNLSDARGVLDRQRYMIIFRIGGREPFFIYFIAFLWWLFPALKGFVVQRIAAAIIFLVGVWLLYLLGVGLRSRRTGVILAGLGAVSKPFLLMSLSGMPIGGVVAAIAWVLIVLLRLAREPKMSRFLLWGLAMAFGTYTYPAFRPWPLLVPALMLLWLLARRDEHRAGWHVAVLPLMVFWALLAGFHRYHLGILGQYPFVDGLLKQWDASAAVRWGFYAALAVVLAKGLGTAQNKARGRRLTGWALGTLLMLALIHPLTLDSEFYERVSNYSVFKEADYQAGALTYLGSKLRLVVRMVFKDTDDRDDLNLGNDPFLDHLSMAFLVLGLAFLLTRPTRKGLFLFGTALFALVPHVLSNDTATTKLIGTLVPLLALGALGAESLLSSVEGGARRAAGRAISAVVLVLFALGAYQQFFKLHVHWGQEDQVNVLVSKEVERAIDLDQRPYLGVCPEFWGEVSQIVLNEGRLYYVLWDPSVIEMAPDEPVPTVVVLAKAGCEELVDRLKREYPNATWESRSLKSLIPEYAREGYLWRVTIPPRDIPETPGSILTVRRVEGRPWVRHFSCFHFGQRFGIALFEDRSAKAGDPVDPVEMLRVPFKIHDGLNNLLVRGRFRAETSGEYEWIVTPKRKVWISVDGRLRACWEPGKALRERSVRVRLDAGEHDFEYKVFFNGKFEVPPLQWRTPGNPAPELF